MEGIGNKANFQFKGERKITLGMPVALLDSRRLTIIKPLNTTVHDVATLQYVTSVPPSIFFHMQIESSC